MPALLPRPTRGDTWITLTLLLLSVVSTAIIEFFDPVPGDRAAWPWGYALILAACLPVLWRSAYTRVTATVSAVAATAYYPLGFPDGLVMLCTMVMLYTVVRWGHRTYGWSLGIGLFLTVNGYELLLGAGYRPEAIGVIAWTLVLLCAAEIMRSRSDYRRAEEERKAEAARTREEELLRRASDERLRLARDVHDTVAHNISLINVQAGTALYLMENQPEQAADALSTIKKTSKDTLSELRAILGVLRAVDEGAPRSPVPGLERVEELVEGTRSVGIDVRVETVGTPSHLPVGTDSAAYRTVQEALTNVVRHSGATHAHVLLKYGASCLVIEVTDDGRGAIGPPAPGNGITGMAERAAIVGGEVDARPLADGGFRVRARLPIDGGAAASSADTSAPDGTAPGSDTTHESRSR